MQQWGVDKEKFSHPYCMYRKSMNLKQTFSHANLSKFKLKLREMGY